MHDTSDKLRSDSELLFRYRVQILLSVAHTDFVFRFCAQAESSLPTRSKAGTSLESSSATPPSILGQPSRCLTPNQDQQEEREVPGSTMLLGHTTDVYDGVTVDKASLPDSIEEFTSVLKTSLKAWRSVGKKGVWLKVTIRLASHQYTP